LSKFRYGLVFQVFRNWLARTGIEFTPYYWVQEGINPTEAPKIKGSASEYSVEFLKEEDMKLIGENARGYSEKEFLEWLKAGKKCLGLRHNSDIAVFMWIDLDICPFEPIDAPLKSDEAYLADMYTMEPYRGKNLAPYLRYYSYEILNKIRRDKIYSVVEYFNTSAMKYKQKLNPRKIKLVFYLRLFKGKKWSYTVKTYHP
jgi:hypothetical protein